MRNESGIDRTRQEQSVKGCGMMIKRTGEHCLIVGLIGFLVWSAVYVSHWNQMRIAVNKGYIKHEGAYYTVEYYNVITPIPQSKESSTTERGE